MTGYGPYTFDDLFSVLTLYPLIEEVYHITLYAFRGKPRDAKCLLVRVHDQCGIDKVLCVSRIRRRIFSNVARTQYQELKLQCTYYILVDSLPNVAL